MRTRTARHVSALMLCAAIVLFTAETVRANPTVVCSWTGVWCGGSSFDWYGGWDLSTYTEDEYLAWSHEICANWTWGCWDACESSAAEQWAAAEAYWQTGCAYPASCFWTFAQTNTCSGGGPTGTMACKCGWMNFCAPC